MRIRLIIITLFFLSLFTSCSTTYYIVRHAEKSGEMSQDPPLTEQGKQRAQMLATILSKNNIRSIYSTNFIRSRHTAQPLADKEQLPMMIYRMDSLDHYISRWKESRGNMLIVGHSNTVDDLVKKMTGVDHVGGDLKDSEYDNLFIIKRTGKKYKYSRLQFTQQGLMQ